MYFYNIFLFFSITTIHATCNRPNISTMMPFPIQKKTSSLRVMSYNIRGESQIDRQRGNSWDHRQYQIQHLITHYSPDIIGMQEVNISYMSNIERLFPDYLHIAFDMTDRDKDSVLLIRKDRFKCQKIGHFWLAQEPAQNKIPCRVDCQTSIRTC